VLTGETDRPYLSTEAAVDLEDPAYKRRINIAKLGSKTTVVWNPWSEVTANIADMSTDGWRRMTCIETANAAENAVTVAAGAQHTMQATISVNEFELHTLLPVGE
jgi:D-hexose-6-phosphate mutarotase